MPVLFSETVRHICIILETEIRW